MSDDFRLGRLGKLRDDLDAVRKTYTCYNVDEVNARIDALSTEIMAIADNGIKCFMVDFTGKSEGTVSEADIEDIPGMIDRTAGPLSSTVRKFLKAFTEGPVDCGGGGLSWHYGVHCTASEAWTLYRDGRKAFRKAIMAGLLHVDIKAWSIA